MSDEKDLQKDLDDNFNEKNLENVRKMLEENPVPTKAYRMMVRNTGYVEVETSEESMRIVAETLLR